MGITSGNGAHMGTWRLNEAKSELGTGPPKNNTVVYEAAGNNVKVTVDGTDNDGKPVHNQWTRMLVQALRRLGYHVAITTTHLGKTQCECKGYFSRE